MRQNVPETLVHEIEREEKNRNFRVTPEDEGFHVEGPGSLDALLVVAYADTFGVRVESSRTSLVSDDFSKLQKFSEELSHVTAKQLGGGERVISVTDFPFRESVSAEVTVTDTTNFEWVRAVYTLGHNVDY